MNRLLQLPSSAIFRQIGNVPNIVEQTLNNGKLFAATSSSLLNYQQTRCRCQAGRYKVTLKHTRPMTYEMSNKPSYIGVRKAWNSWNTSSLVGLEWTAPQLTVDDIYIRQFMQGTWHRLFLSEVIIKRRANLITITGIIHQGIMPRKIYWLIGYTETLLAQILKCPVKIDLQTTARRDALVIKHI